MYIIIYDFGTGSVRSDPHMVHHKEKSADWRIFLFVLFTLLSSFFSLLSVSLRDFFQ